MSQTLRVVCLLVVSLLSIGGEGRPHCDMTEAYADECGKKLIFIGEHTARLPVTDGEMQKQCKNVEEGIACLKKYSKSCMDPFATQMMNIVIKNSDKLDAKYCKDPNGRKGRFHYRTLVIF